MSDKISPKTVVKFLFDLWRISPRATFGMILMQAVFTVLGSTIAPIIVSQLITRISNGSATIDSSLLLLGFYALILIVGDVIMVRISIALCYVAETKMQSSVMKRIMEHLTAKSLGYHSDRMSGRTVSDCSKLVGCVERFWDILAWDVTPLTTTLIVNCIVLGFIFWQYSIVISILSAIIIAVIIKIQTRRVKISQVVSEKYSTVAGHFADVIGNISAVKSFAREKAEIEHSCELTKEWRNASMKEMRSTLLVTGTFSVMMTTLNICAFLAAILATEYHIANIGIVYLTMSYTLSIVRSLWGVVHTTKNFLRLIGDSSPMIATLDEAIEIKDAKKTIKFIAKKGAIKFDNVSFCHDKSTCPLFNNFTLDIKPGEKVGVVGKSGAGKTSLSRLLLRFSDINCGAILIDGQDISKITQNDLRENIAYVPQEPALFHRTLRENIAYGKPNATDAEIRQAAEKANALEFIDALPDKLDTIVGERGVKLSGGQRQRIAIARVILKDAPILLLDEATSALDSESEKLIQDALSKLMRERTSIIIAHRLSTIAKLDRIIVMDDGKIVEQGTHDDLLANNGIYAKLWKHQSGGFIE